MKKFENEGSYLYFLYKYNGIADRVIDVSEIKMDYREYFFIIENLSMKYRLYLRHSFGAFNPFYNKSLLGFYEYIRGHKNDEREGDNAVSTSVEFAYPIIKEWEFSIKLPFLPQKLTSTNISVFLTAFTDAGTTFNNHYRFDINDFYSGYGFGINLLFLPQTAYRFEYAFNEYKKGEFIFGTGFSF